VWLTSDRELSGSFRSTVILRRGLASCLDKEMKLKYSFFMETVISIMGQKIRELRLDRGLTLEEAAERAGCTSGFLSQVERNQAVPSISMLYAIAQALDVHVTHFFPWASPGTKVVHAGDREIFRFEGSSIAYSLLSAKFPGRKLEPLLVYIDPKDGSLPSDEFRSHPGEEFYYVLKGTLRLQVGDEVFDLNQGDSLHFKSTVKHRMDNPSECDTRALCVLTPSVF
jgi:transcriptional regulator with XRE-family HTH domain